MQSVKISYREIVAQALETLRQLCGFEFAFQPWKRGAYELAAKEIYPCRAGAQFGMATDEGSEWYLTFETPDGKVSIQVSEALYDCFNIGDSIPIKWQVSRLSPLMLKGKFDHA